MEKEASQQVISKLESMDKSLAKIAEAMSVLKVIAVAMILALLIVVLKNFLP